MLGHESSPNKFERIEKMQNMFFGEDGVKVEIKMSKITHPYLKSPETSKPMYE